MTQTENDVVHGLAMAIIRSSATPMVLLDSSFRVISASASFARVFRLDADALPGRTLFDCGGGEWNSPQLKALLRVILAGGAEIEAYEMDLPGVRGAAAHKLIIHAQKLDYGAAPEACLLLTITDVTQVRLDERMKDDLIREKAVLLKELQHRVANSLQIIASVLMQSARRVQSEETRAHLENARNRVMSVATLQQQLSASSEGPVRLDDYFGRLCESLSASMVHDAEQISIIAIVDDSEVDAPVSVCLGLIVTELVINALKHAFPEGKGGKILVRYQSSGTGWQLSVSDTGSGTRDVLAAAKPGLGTSIVEALASQLGAVMSITDEHPGIAVHVTHAAVGEDDAPEEIQGAV